MEPVGQRRSFDRKTALITGGASGVGFACAELFGAAGANVTIVGRDEGKLERACGKLKNNNIANVQYLAGNVADSTFADRAVDCAGGSSDAIVDVLINSAGVILRKEAIRTSDADWQKIIDVNLTGVFYFSRAVAKQLIGEGAIVNVSSTCGQVGAAGLAAYCASKGAVEQLTRAMALELAPRGITVNAVAPGAINSPMLFSKHCENAPDQNIVADNVASIPLGAIAEPVEVARAIKFLASERHITGEILSIDGGFTAK